MPAHDDLVCDACGLPPQPPVQAVAAGAAATNAVAPGTAADELPAGWVRRKIGRRTFTLCDCCGSIHHFKGGISAYLQDALGLGPNAMCDFAEAPGSGLHRLRVRRADGEPGDGGGGGAS